MMVAALMDLIDTTILNVALPSVQRDLGASATALEWVVSGYLLGFAATLITAGRLGDLAGRKRLFLLGVAMFAAASLLCGLAVDPGQLIAARVVQGVAAATLIPQVLATFTVLFSGRQRSAVFGAYGGMAGLAAVAGLLLGGLLTDANLFGLGWRMVFLVNVPVATVVLLAAAVVVPETRAHAPARLDLTGAVVLSAGVVAVVYPLLEGRVLGWPGWSFAMLGAGVLALVALPVVEARRAPSRPPGCRPGWRSRVRPAVAPVLPPALLRARAVVVGLLIQLVFSGGQLAFFFVFALWLQAGQHYSPTRAGATTAAYAIGGVLFAGIGARLGFRHGRGVLVAGAVLLAAGTLVVDLAVTLAAGDAAGGVSPWHLMPGLAVAGSGLGLLVVPLLTVVLAGAPRADGGAVSGVFSTVQQLGGAIGIAVIGAVFFARLSATGGYTPAVTTALPWIAGAFGLCALLALALPSITTNPAGTGAAQHDPDLDTPVKEQRRPS